MVNVVVDVVKYLKFLIVICMLFFYVYNIKFIFFPLTTNMIYAVLGLLVFIYLLLSNKIKISKDTLGCVFLFFLFFSQSLIAILINATYELGFLMKELIPCIILPFFSALFIAYVSRRVIDSICLLLKAIVIVTLIQSILCIVGFIYPAFGDFLVSLQAIAERLDTTYEENKRAFGFGSGFDLGAFIISYSLLIVSYFYIDCKRKRDEMLLLVVFFILSLAGLLMARSIIIGIGLSCIFILFVNKERTKKVSFVLSIFVSCFLLLFVLLISFPNFIEDNYPTIIWIFEFFMDNNQLDKSSNTLTVLFGRMYFLPELKTWFWGDGQYLSPLGAIYKDTDPLYMRYLLYFGLPGLLFFLLYNFSLIKRTLTCKGYIPQKYNKIIVLFFILNLIVYIKVNAHFYYLVYYILWSAYFYKLSIYENEKYIICS